MSAHLTFENVTLAVDGARVFGPVSLNLNTPGITMVLGANGSGKSLFLSLAHGILTPSAGRVTWNGKQAALTRGQRGYVFQNAPVLRRSVAGNIALPLAAQNLLGSERRALLTKALFDARLTDVADKPAAALSGGERQRLALARAMVCAPNVLFLDEPAANLDPGSTADLERSLKSIAASGTKILMASHDVPQACRLADEVLFFDAGGLVEHLDAASFFKKPASPAAQKYLKGLL